MRKLLTIALVLSALLFVADAAQARCRHRGGGCASSSTVRVRKRTRERHVVRQRTVIRGCATCAPAEPIPVKPKLK